MKLRIATVDTLGTRRAPARHVLGVKFHDIFPFEWLLNMLCVNFLLHDPQASCLYARRGPPYRGRSVPQLTISQSASRRTRFSRAGRPPQQRFSSSGSTLPRARTTDALNLEAPGFWASIHFFEQVKTAHTSEVCAYYHFVNP